MLNAREPKIVNGPEILNKYVGASEENIRKLFADAEKEVQSLGFFLCLVSKLSFHSIRKKVTRVASTSSSSTSWMPFSSNVDLPTMVRVLEILWSTSYYQRFFHHDIMFDDLNPHVDGRC